MSRIVVDVTHPAHVHFFRPAMRIWQSEGHELEVVARDKDVTLALLDHYGFEYTVLSKARKGLVGLAIELLEHEGRLQRLIRRTRPDVVLEVAGTFIVHAAAMTGIPSLVFYDTEHARLQNAITYPFATRIITPAAYRRDLGEKHIRYNGYQELAYLHPRYFKPDPQIRRELDLSNDEVYSVLRFVSWDASHDRGHAGMPVDRKRDLVALLARYGRVIISSEAPLPDEFEPYRVSVPPHKMHDLLAAANLYVGEGATMASEAAILGTPAIYTNSLSLGYLEDQEVKYGLVHNLPDSESAMAMVNELLEKPNVHAEFVMKRNAMLADTIDVTEFICDEVEGVISGQVSRDVEAPAGQAATEDRV